MNPAGIIIRYINWRKWKKWFFNVPLFLFQLLFLVVGKILGKVEVEWGEIWHAAQVSHVRLVLEPATTLDGASEQYFWTMNFGYKYAEIQIWDIDWNDDKHLEYFDPTFETSPEFVERMIDYAWDQVGKRYDDVQLLSYAPHLAVWTIYPPCWGKELKIIKALNRPGALEVCISGLVADLRWAEDKSVPLDIPIDNIFFVIYDTAVIPPCMVPISEKWRKL